MICSALAFLTSCQKTGAPPAAAAKEAPAKIANGGIKESDLATVQLSEQAEKRLGIETAVAGEVPPGATASWPGEVVLPAGQSITVNAPVTGSAAFVAGPLAIGSAVRAGDPLLSITPYLAAERDLRTTLEADVTAAQTRVTAAKARYDRAEQLLKDQVGTVRAKETAEEELGVANAALAAAKARLDRFTKSPLEADIRVAVPSPQPGIVRQIFVTAGQSVPGGAPLFEIARLDPVWVRVPVYVGELSRIARGAPASIRALNASPGSPSRSASPVPAPPTADPMASTADLYFSLANGDSALRPGERLSVSIPLKRGAAHRGGGIAVPSSAIVYDIHGNAWVYRKAANRKYARQRVETSEVSGGNAIISRGLEKGAVVVTAGAAELFGSEFGPGK